MKIPTFRYQGGKARIRARLVELFPRSGGLYVEPFAGRGNVFFLARTCLSFDGWILNDLNSVEFLTALIQANLEDLPQGVSREEFERIRYEDSPVSRILEPIITFCGKGYRYGYSGI